MANLDRLTCQETFARLDDYLHRELQPEDLEAVQSHLDYCAHCAEAFEFEASVVECVKRKIDAMCVPDELTERIKKALDQAT